MAKIYRSKVKSKIRKKSKYFPQVLMFVNMYCGLQTVRIHGVNKQDVDAVGDNNDK